MARIPDAFKDEQKFVVYKVVPSSSRPGKTDKFPCNLAGQIVSAHDPANWLDATTAEAAAAAYGPGYGVGFAFTESDPFWFLDIDECRLGDGTPENPFTWSPLAQQLCGLLAGCAIEISQSGRGLHIFGTGRPPAHGCTNKALGLEFYHTGRFAALTGTNAIGNAATDASAVLPALVCYILPCRCCWSRRTSVDRWTLRGMEWPNR
jgi:primase-polymerase (primpol)-like protein